MMNFCAALLALALQDAGAFKHENTEANLKQLFEKLHKAVVAGDDATALTLTNSVIPNEDALKMGLKDGLPAESLAKAVEFHAKMIPTDPAKRAKLFAADPANTEVRVHAATTEEIAKSEEGSTAYHQFPSGAKKLAEDILRPGLTYYVVVPVPPGKAGKPLGVKFHLFYWAGDHWSMLGPIWRAFN